MRKGLKQTESMRINVSGFLDTKGVREDVAVEIVLHYGEEVERRVVKLKYLDGFDWVSFFEVLLVLGVLGFVVWRIRCFVEDFS